MKNKVIIINYNFNFPIKISCILSQLFDSNFLNLIYLIML
uniref:Uncharacterized protein n=1 Tax=Polysiphonia sertularioides TaxID=945028 RepID=A0A1Z1MGI6_9FLOR|nr:hypothetical protein [Polysiphonia sertularioides]